MSITRKRLLLLITGLAGAAATVPAFAVGADMERTKEAVAAPVGEKGNFLHDLLPLAWQRHPRVNFNVYTQMTAEGRKRPVPSADHPIRYYAQPGTFAQLGWLPIGGERPPPWAQLQATMEKELAANGYVKTGDDTTRPDVLIVFSFGSHGSDFAALAANPRTGEPEFPPPVNAEELMPYILRDPMATRDLVDRARFIGGDTISLELVGLIREESSLSATNLLAGLGMNYTQVQGYQNLVQRTGVGKIRDILELAVRPCYYVTATAYDFNGVANKEKIPLWQTRMTVEAQGISMGEVLKPMIATTGPFLGRETPEAVTFQRRLDREGTVEVGTPTVIKEDVPVETAPEKK